MEYSIILQNLLIILAMIAVGFVAGKVHLIPHRASADFTTLLMQVALPCMIFMSMQRPFEMAMLRDSVTALGLCFVLVLLFLGGSCLLSGKLGMERICRGTWSFCVTFGNSGFMGFPLIRAIFGNDGLFVAAVMGIAYLGIEYTICIRMMTHFSSQAEAESANWKKILLGNTNIALVLGLFFFVTQLPVPETVQTVVSSFANITTPLSMFLIGLSLSEGKLLSVFRNRNAVSCSAMRLLGVPVITACILRLLPFTSDLVKGVILLSFAMPCPSLGMIFSQEYGGDVNLASSSIFLSSVCCIATIPLVLMLL